MKRAPKIVGIACAGLLAAQADADVPMSTGNDLLRSCERNRLSCMGYVSGVADTLLLWDSLEKRRRVCYPKNVTRGQTTDVVVAYLHARPDIRHEPEVFLVVSALIEAFPCPKENNR